MAIATIEIRGEKEMQRIFRILPQKLSRKLQLSGLRKGAALLVKTIRAEAPRRTGTLAKSVGTVNDKNRKGAAIYVGVRTGKKMRYDGWYGWFIHAGTRGFGKRLKDPETGARRDVQGRGLLYSFSGKAGSQGLRPNPFMQRAWNSTKQRVLETITVAIRDVVIKFLQQAKPNYY